MSQSPPYIDFGKAMVMTAAMQASLYLLPLTGTISPRTPDLIKQPQTNATAEGLSLAWLDIEQHSHWAMMAKQELDILAQTHPSWRTAFDLAEMVLLVLNDVDLRPDRIMPSAENGVAFYFFRPSGYALIECLTSKEIVALTKDEISGQLEVWEVGSDQDMISTAATRIRSFTSPMPYEHTAASSGLA